MTICLFVPFCPSRELLFMETSQIDVERLESSALMTFEQCEFLSVSLPKTPSSIRGRITIGFKLLSYFSFPLQILVNNIWNIIPLKSFWFLNCLVYIITNHISKEILCLILLLLLSLRIGDDIRIFTNR